MKKSKLSFENSVSALSFQIIGYEYPDDDWCIVKIEGVYNNCFFSVQKAFLEVTDFWLLADETKEFLNDPEKVSFRYFFDEPYVIITFKKLEKNMVSVNIELNSEICAALFPDSLSRLDSLTFSYQLSNKRLQNIAECLDVLDKDYPSKSMGKKYNYVNSLKNKLIE